MKTCLILRCAAIALVSSLTLLSICASAQMFAPLHQFGALNSSTKSDGALPYATLVLSSNVLNGTTFNGGANSNGTVFAVNTDGTGFTNLHTFSVRAGLLRTNSDGAQPVAGLVLSGNMLYGTTGAGGLAGRGTIYAVSRDGNVFTNLHSFNGNSDGSATAAALTPVGTNFYGAAQSGGSNGLGMVFILSPDGSYYTNLHSFATTTFGTNNEGSQPLAGMTLSGTNLFGTCGFGGAGGKGSVFRMDTDGTGFTNLHSFTPLVSNTNGDGAQPFGEMTLSGSNLFGTAFYGGASGNGALFRINIYGSGYTNFHSFTALNNRTNSDGANPFGSLIRSGDTLYGAASAGGSQSNGTIFVVNTDGSGFRVLYNFTALINGTNSDGTGPVAGILSSNTLFGLEHAGGIGGSGTVFSLFLPPLLTIGVFGANTILTWPTNAAGFILQSNADLGVPAAWSAVSPAPVVENGQNVVTNGAAAGKMFYRLAR